MEGGSCCSGENVDVSAAGSRLIPGKGQEGAVCARAQKKESEMQINNGRQSPLFLTGTQQRA